MDEFILGVDEAGKGPVIGSLVIAGCIITRETEKKLRKLGVKDSKKLTAKRRDFLVEEVKKMAVAYEIISISANEIDEHQEQGTKLNEMEAIVCADIINKLNDGTKKLSIIVDCPSVSPEKWKDFLKSKINNLSNLNISCEHKADSNHICVAAASILAKDERERQMKELRKEFGEEMGSGYCSDFNTQRFLQKYASTYKDKGIFRKCWSTWQVAYQELSQKKL
jgi:ribonuclease HII